MLGAKFGQLGTHFPSQAPHSDSDVGYKCPTLIFISDDSLFYFCLLQVHLDLLAQELPADVPEESLGPGLSPFPTNRPNPSCLV